MAIQFRSDDNPWWPYKYGSGAYDATFSSTADHSWDGTTRFQAQGAITGTAGQTSFVKPASWSHTGYCLLYQARGTGVGKHELQYVDFSGASATTLAPLQNTYTTGAQVITLSNGTTGYRNVTINSGVTLSAPIWGGTTGGVLAIMANGTITITGSLSAAARGFAGGRTGYLTSASYPHSGATGEGTAGASVAGGQNPGTDDDLSPANTSSGNAGGGGRGARSTDRSSGGGGGGNGAAGTAGSYPTESPVATPGNGGAASGALQLTTMTFGGGGGGGGKSKDGDSALYGGRGGGIIFLICRHLVVTGTATVAGAKGDDGTSDRGGAGGGAGGSILVKCITADIGTNKVLATKGAKGSGPADVNDHDGGDGGGGRIHIDYLQSVTGSISSSYYGTYGTRQDFSLRMGASTGVII